MTKRIAVWLILFVVCQGQLFGENPESDRNTNSSSKPVALIGRFAVDHQPVNGGFELGRIGELPEDWKVPKIPGYSISISEQQPAIGSKCVTIVSVEGPEKGPFGNLLQAVDARPFRGHRVRLRGAVRAEVSGRGNQAQMWLRVDWRSAEDGARQIGAFDNMANRPITSGEWDYYEIVADVDVDAEYVTIGVFLRGEGKAWVDDVSLDIVDAMIPTTARHLGGRSAGTPLDELTPGLYEVVTAERLSLLEPKELEVAQKAGHDVTGLENPSEVTVLLPLPLSYRDQVPLNFEVTVMPREAVQLIDIYEDQPGNYVLKLVASDVPTWKAVDIRYTSTLLVGPSSFEAVPATAPLPEAWPDEAMPWLAATWCADADHERIRTLAGEIRADTYDVLEIIRRV